MLAGKWGNGDERKKKLEAAGYNYNTIQKKVNELSKSGSRSTKKVTAKDSAKSYDESLAGTYKTTDALNVRTGAGTSKAILVCVPKGTSVKCYGYYTTVSGVKWYYVQFTYKGVRYTGFCSSKHLKK